jgi:hypothetical protein
MLAPEPRMVEIGGQLLALRFQIGDFLRAERKWKAQLTEQEKADGYGALFPLTTRVFLESSSLWQITLILFVGLQHAKPDVTIEWIEDAMPISFEDRAKLGNVVDAAVKDFFETVMPGAKAIFGASPIFGNSTGTGYTVGADTTTG